MVERLDRLMANINSVAGDEEVQEDVKAIAGSLKDAAADIDELLTLWRTETERLARNVDTTITSTDQNLDDSFMKLNNVLENLDDSTKRLTVMMDAVANGEGTAGLLVRDDRLYEAGVLALLRLADVVDSVGRITAMIEEEKAIPIAAKTGLGTFKTSLPLDAAAGGGN